MSNNSSHNSSARCKKDKKKKDKKKKTDPPSLHKEDRTSTDSSSLSLSPAGADKVAELLVPGAAQSVFLLEFNRSLTEDQQQSITVQVAEENPGASAKEVMNNRRAFKLKAGLEALKKKGRADMDSSHSLSLSAGTKRGTVSTSSAR
jgi:hypothetical protein